MPNQDFDLFCVSVPQAVGVLSSYSGDETISSLRGEIPQVSYGSGGARI